MDYPEMKSNLIDLYQDRDKVRKYIQHCKSSQLRKELCKDLNEVSASIIMLEDMMEDIEMQLFN